MSAYDEFVSKVKAKFENSVSTQQSQVTKRKAVNLLGEACSTVALDLELSLSVLHEKRNTLLAGDQPKCPPVTLVAAIHSTVSRYVFEELSEYCHSAYLDLGFVDLEFEDIESGVRELVSAGLDVASKGQGEMEEVYRQERGLRVVPPEQSLKDFREKLSAIGGAVILLSEEGWNQEIANNLKALVSEVGGRVISYSKGGDLWELYERVDAYCDFFAERGEILFEQRAPGAFVGG